jgi:aldehyde:ferredoxin oxidoreductase
MKLLRLNMETGTIEFERLREDWLPIGGSALLARIMNREVPPPADPPGPELP